MLNLLTLLELFYFSWQPYSRIWTLDRSEICTCKSIFDHLPKTPHVTNSLLPRLFGKLKFLQMQRCLYGLLFFKDLILMRWIKSTVLIMLFHLIFLSCATKVGRHIPIYSYLVRQHGNCSQSLAYVGLVLLQWNTLWKYLWAGGSERGKGPRARDSFCKIVENDLNWVGEFLQLLVGSGEMRKINFSDQLMGQSSQEISQSCYNRNLSELGGL